MSNLDTRNKRSSALGIDLSFLRVYEDPDGTINQGDRQQTALKYEGILAGFLLDSTRASMLGLDLAFPYAPPFPDGSINSGDRQQLAHKYRNIAAGPPPAASTIGPLCLLGVG